MSMLHCNISRGIAIVRGKEKQEGNTTLCKKQAINAGRLSA